MFAVFYLQIPTQTNIIQSSRKGLGQCHIQHVVRSCTQLAANLSQQCSKLAFVLASLCVFSCLHTTSRMRINNSLCPNASSFIVPPPPHIPFLCLSFRRGFQQFFWFCPFVRLRSETLQRREALTSRYSCSGSPDHNRIVRNGK